MPKKGGKSPHLKAIGPLGFAARASLRAAASLQALAAGSSSGSASSAASSLLAMAEGSGAAGAALPEGSSAAMECEEAAGAAVAESSGAAGAAMAEGCCATGTALAEGSGTEESRMVGCAASAPSAATAACRQLLQATCSHLETLLRQASREAARTGEWMWASLPSEGMNALSGGGEPRSGEDVCGEALPWKASTTGVRVPSPWPQVLGTLHGG